MNQRVDRDGLPVLVAQQPVVVDQEFLVLDTLREGLRVRAGMEAQPGVGVNVVEPQVVHAVAIGLDIAVNAFAEEEGTAQVWSKDQGFGTPRTAPCLAPLRVRGGGAEIHPLVVAQRLDFVEMRSGLAGHFSQRPFFRRVLAGCGPSDNQHRNSRQERRMKSPEVFHH